MAAMRRCTHCLKETELEHCPADGFRTQPIDTFEAPVPGSKTGPGSLLMGRYKLRECIGTGGFGAVYKALNTTMDQTVAIKVLRMDTGGITPEQIKRFHREARTASQLRHPNTIRVFDFGETEDKTLFLVMEFLEGFPLDKLLAREGALPVERAVHIGIQLLRSLGEAHKKGIVHRDMKPENVFLTAHEGVEDFVKVLDFGIAKATAKDSSESNLTTDGKIIGSPQYMAPEQIQNQPLDARTDLYAAGLILYRMVTGRAPFEAVEMMAILFAHVSTPPAPIPVQVNGRAIPESLRALVTAMLEKEPAKRPQSAAEALAVLEPLAGEYRGSGVRPRAVSPVAAAVAFQQTLSTTGQTLAAGLEAQRLRQKRRPLWLALGAVAAVALSVGLWIALRPPPTAEAAREPTAALEPKPSRASAPAATEAPPPPKKPEAPPVLAVPEAAPPPATPRATRIKTNVPAELIFNGVSIGSTRAGPLAWTPPPGAARVSLTATPEDLNGGFKTTSRTVDVTLDGTTELTLDAVPAPPPPTTPPATPPTTPPTAAPPAKPPVAGTPKPPPPRPPVKRPEVKEKPDGKLVLPP